MRHTLTGVDRETKTATCSICGPTKVQVRANGVRCGGKRRADKAIAKIRSYGITLDDWHAMLIAQSGRCAICEDPMREPHVDHDHDTRAVRALLCRVCNLTLGHALEDVDRLRRAADYLETQEGPREFRGPLADGRVGARSAVLSRA